MKRLRVKRLVRNSDSQQQILDRQKDIPMESEDEKEEEKINNITIY